MSVYQVTALRWSHGWELHIHDDAGEEIGVTQSRSLAGAKRMVCDYLALDLGGEPEYYDVTITPKLDGDVAVEAAAARQAVRDAEQAQRDAAARQRDAARHLKDSDAPRGTLAGG